MKRAMNFTGILLAVALCLVSCKGNSKSESNGVVDEPKKEVNIPTEYCEELVKLAEEGNAEAQMNLAKCYVKGEGVERNFEEANKWLLKAAEQGNTDAMNEMGTAYLNGWGVPVDYKEAVKWYRKSAEQGNAVGQAQLGACYAEGSGVPQNHKEAFNLFQKAAEQGDVIAQKFLADYYLTGYATIGIPQDFDKAFDLYLKAAEQGLGPAQTQVGVCYMKGLGTSQNTSKAIEWLKKASEKEPIALFNLGVIYINGEGGVSQDIGQGLEYMRKAASLGHEGAKRALQMYQ